MNKIFENILWEIYNQSASRIGGRYDSRFILLNDLIKDIHNLTGKQLNTIVADLKKQKFIEKKKDYENSVLVSLTEKGMLRVLNYRFRRLGDKKEEWDGRWRMVSFDIPNSRRKGRNALRYRLKSGGFYELQESLFLHPYDCKKEVDDFVKLFNLEKYVRFGLLDFIDNQDKLKSRFKIK
jgi:phenylacetic acid degradation operon negative regulatory protein